jgi:ABC-type transport system substrate-binding protein
MLRPSRSIALALAGALCVSACDAIPPPDATFVSPSDIKTFDPVDAGDLYAGGAQRQVYDGLLEYDYLKRPPELIPALASALPEISEDELTFTFHLRDDIYFHDSTCFDPERKVKAKGRRVVAEDFVYCWKRLVAMPDSKGNWVLAGKIIGLDEWAARAGKKLGELQDKRNRYYPFEHPEMRELVAEPVEGLRALDDTTFQVKLSEAYPQFLWVLAMSYTVVYPHEALEEHGLEFRYHPVGTGPYTVDEFWPFDLKVSFTRNPTFRESF